MGKPDTIIVDGHALSWRRLVELRRQQLATWQAAQAQQLTWFLVYGGDILREAGRLDDAESWLTKAIADDPDSAMAFAFKGSIGFDNGRFAAAMSDLKKAVEIDPTYRRSRSELAKVARIAEHWDAATEAYRFLLEANPDDLDARSEIAAIALRRGDLTKADEYIADLRSRDPEEPFYLFLESLADVMRGDLQESRRRADQALTLLPQGPIGKFIFLFSQLEFTIRHAIMECLKLKEDLGDAVTAPYDFVATCRVADRLLKERHHGKPEVVQEIDKVFKECLKLNEQRVRIVHGSWIFGSSAWHTSRTTLQSTEYFKTSAHED